MFIIHLVCFFLKFKYFLGKKNFLQTYLNRLNLKVNITRGVHVFICKVTSLLNRSGQKLCLDIDNITECPDNNITAFEFFLTFANEPYFMIARYV